MKGLGTLVRLRKWELEEKRRKLAELEALAGQLDETIARLDDELVLERNFAANDPLVSFSYPAYAQAAIERRRKLKASADEVRQQIEEAKAEVTVAYQELKKYEVARASRVRRAQQEEDRRETIRLDEIGVESFRRRPN